MLFPSSECMTLKKGKHTPKWQRKKVRSHFLNPKHLALSTITLSKSIIKYTYISELFSILFLQFLLKKLITALSCLLQHCTVALVPILISPTVVAGIKKTNNPNRPVTGLCRILLFPFDLCFVPFCRAVNLYIDLPKPSLSRSRSGMRSEQCGHSWLCEFDRTLMLVNTILLNATAHDGKAYCSK